MINIEDTLAGLILIVEETKRFNHNNCGDTRNRLYITLKSNGCYVAYCHNCGESGYSRVFAHYLTTSISSTEYQSVDDKYLLPTRLELITQPPVEWCTLEQATLAGVKYDPKTERFIIPVADGLEINASSFKNPCGFISRRQYKTQQPKYLTYIPKGYQGWMNYWNNTIVNKEVLIILVEDQISAAWLAHCGHYGVAMFGAKHSLEKIHEIHKHFTKEQPVRMLVWYDNDNEEVNRAARYSYEYLNLLGRNAELCTSSFEPKHCSKEQIENIIKAL